MMSFAPWRPQRTDTGFDPAALLARLACGELAALEELYRREAGAVYRYALALSGNADWAADVTQDAFIALAAKPQGFDGARASLGAYLAGVARHGLLALWRRARHELQPAQSADDEVHESSVDDAEAAPSPETLLVREQTEAQLWLALRALPWPFREALVLVDLQQRSYLEAAQIAGIELNTLRTRVHRARARLAASLDAQPGDLS